MKGREVAAVCYNQKQGKVLEKTLATLTLEESYSMKLLDLTHKDCKKHQRRLKDKVSKIKSHLTADEIAEIRSLEIRGKLEPKVHSFNLSNASRIIAASKRLKLQSDEERMHRHHRAQSAIEARRKSSTQSATQRRTLSASASCLNHDSNDTPVLAGRPYSAVSLRGVTIPEELEVDYNEEQQAVKVRPSTSIPGGDRHVKTTAKEQKPRAKTAVGLQRSASVPSRKLSTQETPYTDYGSVSLSNMAAVSRKQTPRRKTSDSSFGSVQALNDQYSEMKREMLEEAQETNAALAQKTDEFLVRVNRWVKDNSMRDVHFDHSKFDETIKRVSVDETSSTTSADQETSSFLGIPTGPRSARRRARSASKLPHVMFDGMNERPPNEKDVYLKRIHEAWEDVQNCRYPRQQVPSVKITAPRVVNGNHSYPKPYPRQNGTANNTLLQA